MTQKYIIKTYISGIIYIYRSKCQIFLARIEKKVCDDEVGRKRLVDDAAAELRHVSLLMKIMINDAIFFCLMTIISFFFVNSFKG